MPTASQMNSVMAKNEQLESVLEEAKETIIALEARLVEITTPPLSVSTVQSVDLESGVCSLATGESIIDVLIPAHMKDTIVIGDVVQVESMSKQIIGPSGCATIGEIALIKRVIDNNTVEVDVGGTVKVVTYNKLFKHEKGDRVQLDLTRNIIVRNLGKDDEQFKFSGETAVTWDDIGGLEDAKLSMREALELPYQYREIFAHYSKSPAKGILLWGPPGCGKTLLAKAAVSSIAATHGAETTNTALIYVKGPEILSKWVGESEAVIRGLFQRAREHHKEHGYPAVLFIDEAESIMNRRGSGISSDMDRTIVPMFLSEMDGLDESHAIVIMATNRPDMLDPAVTRDGRVDRKIEIPRPRLTEASSIFGIHLRNKPLAKKTKSETLVELACEMLFDDELKLKKIVMKDGGSRFLRMKHVLNGAMIATLVEKATGIAIRRDIESGKPSGITEGDIKEAIEDAIVENKGLGLKTEVKELMGGKVSGVASVERVI